jgi:uncharacterized membrane protein YiaA
MPTMAGEVVSLLPRIVATSADGKSMSSFGTYLIGFIILILGLAIAAYLLNVPALWIVVGVIVLIGIGILMATSRTKMKDPPSSPGPGPGPRV